MGIGGWSLKGSPGSVQVREIINNNNNRVLLSIFIVNINIYVH